MSKIILSLSLLILLSVVVFGQSFAGYYKAQFIALDANTPKPIVEFEIQSNSAVNGKITIGAVMTIIKGQINYNGNLEAKSERINNTVYTLKANMKSSDGRITLNSLSEEKSFGRQTGAQTTMRGSYSRAGMSGAPPTAVNRKSELIIEQPNPLFEREFTSGEAKIIVEKSGFFTLYHFQMAGGGENTERGFYFSIARASDSPQKIWKVENIRGMNYIEKTENYTKINRFRIDYEKWLKNKDAASGEIELISENSRQMIFKINNLKIKNEANNDFVIINGIVYAEISR